MKLATMLRSQPSASIAVSAVAFAGLFFAGKWIGGQPALAQSAAPIPQKPRYVQFVTTVSNASVQRPDVRSYASFEAVRGDGARVYGHYNPRFDGKTYLARRIVVPSTGLNVVVMDDVRAVTTTYLPAGHPDRTGSLQPDPSRDCAGPSPSWKFKGRDVHNGIPVVLHELHDKQGRVMQWLAPSLDCAALRSFSELFDPATGGTTSKSERTATSVALGEPPASLFEVPRWQERSPLSAEEDYSRMFQRGVVDPGLSARMEAQENRYKQRQRPN